jgi:hypothetical protein
VTGYVETGSRLLALRGAANRDEYIRNGGNSMDYRYRPLALILAAGILAAFSPDGASAQRVRPPRTTAAYVPGSMGIPQPEPKITLSVQNRSLARILYEIFKQTPYKYRVLADVGTTVFSLDVDGVPLSQALRTLLAQDKGKEPLVFSFQKELTGGGTFTVDREYIEVGRVEGENRVSIANARITKVLPEVFKLMNMKYRIEPDVPPLLVSLQLRPSDWSHVLPQIMIEANKQEPGLTYSQDGDTYVVHLHKTFVSGNSTALAPATPRRVKVTAANMPLKDVLAQLFEGSTWKYQVSDAVKDTNITYAASGEPELAALAGVLRQAGMTGRQQLTYREGKGVLYIEPGPLPGEAVVSSRTPTGPQGTVTLNVNQLPLKVVVDSIAQQSGTMIRIAPNVPNIRISIQVDKAPVEQALQTLLQSVADSIPNLTVRSTGNGIYSLELGATM